MSLVYLFSEPISQPTGGTWLGYLGGIISALIVFWLAFLGIRKRKYNNTQDRAVSWVSAHVYLGTSLLVVTTLHSGFHIGLNVHTLAYLLTGLVVLSGFYGLFSYSVYPTKITNNRDGMSRDAMFSEVAELDEKCLALSEKVNPEVFANILRNVEGTQIKSLLFTRIFSDAGVPDDVLQESIKFISSRIANLDEVSESDKLKSINSLLLEKADLVRRIELDIRYHTRLDWWLFLHVPLTVGLLISILIHIYVVLYYW